MHVETLIAPLAPVRALRNLLSRAWDVLWRRVEISRGKYLLWASTLSLTLSAAGVAVYWLVAKILALGEPPTPPEETPHLAEMLIGWVVVAPLVETILLALIVGIARALTHREVWHVIVGAVPFGLLHGFKGVTPYDAGGHAFVAVISFVVITIAYVAWRRSSLKEAFWMCACVHGIHNFVIVLVVLADQVRTGGYGA